MLDEIYLIYNLALECGFQPMPCIYAIRLQRERFDMLEMLSIDKITECIYYSNRENFKNPNGGDYYYGGIWIDLFQNKTYKSILKSIESEKLRIAKRRRLRLKKKKKLLKNKASEEAFI